MDRVWGYEAAVDTGTVTVHMRRLRAKIEDDPSVPPAPRDGLGRRLPVQPVIGLAVVVAVATLARRERRSRSRSACSRASALQLAGLALLAVTLPLAVVFLSGWVMFHMGDDVKILAVAAASASVAVGASAPPRAARSRRGSGGLRDASPRDRRRRPRRARRRARPARARRAGARRSTPWPPSSSASSTPVASSSPGRVTTCGRRSASLQAMLEAIEDGLAEPEEYLPAINAQVRTLSARVDDLFELAWIDAGALTLELRDAELGDARRRLRPHDRARGGAEGRPPRGARRAGARRTAHPDKIERVAPQPRRERASAHARPTAPSPSSSSPGAGRRAGLRRGHGRGARAGSGAPHVRPLLARRPRALGRGRRARLAIARGSSRPTAARIWAERRADGGARVSFTLPAV